MTISHSLLALSALTLPAAAAVAQYAPWPSPPPMGQPMPPPPMPPAAGPVLEPWMAQPPPPAAMRRPAPAPAAANARGTALEPIDLPPAIEQGVDMIYIDQELVPNAAKQNRGLFHDINFSNWSGAPVDLFVAVNPIYTELRRGLVRYRQRWGDLPRVEVPGGAALKTGATGARVALLRERVGLNSSGTYDAALASAVKEFQAVHGLKADGIAGAGTIDALNRGPEYYEQLIIINMERAKRLPAPQEQRKYAVVDAGNARLSLWEDGRKVDSMKIIVGKPETATPMMAAYIKYVSVNPYWNVPPELLKTLIAPKVVKEGVGYLTDREYQVLTNYTPDAKTVDPNTIDWQAVADGREEVRLRRLPSPANSMRNMKFMLPNYFGIYLHDTPGMDLFLNDDRWISNGCVRVEDYKRFARWLFNGYVPQGSNPKVEEDAQLAEPVPIYMTYLTVQPTATGVQFFPDHYGRDAQILERFGPQLMAAVRS